ncbi:MAG: translation initiation factor IF-2 [Candidatus Woesearchaeota archaeon]
MDTHCIRSPICAVVGHVDHGKSSILDYIRNTNIVASEAGSITQAIGASIIPIEMITQKCEHLVKSMNMNFTIPGLLFIDTPGHAAFSSLRKRGGSLADIAIVVVDIKEGFKPQTIESIKILQDSKTPFIIAVNKIDTLHSYKTQVQNSVQSVLGNMQKQSANLQSEFETKMYEIVQKSYELGFPAERFDRVSDFTKEVALVPVSALKGDGMPELLMVLSALTQKYLEKKLHISAEGPAKGTILEIKESQGVGTVLDTIIYDGTLSVGDIIVIGDLHEPIVTKVKGLYVPATAKDMRDSKSKYTSVKSVCAATGVRICAQNLDRVSSGMPIAVCTEDNVVQVQKEIMTEIESIDIPLKEKGVIVKADTIGSLEALVSLLSQEDIPVREATVGEISKRDLLEVEANLQTDPDNAVLLGFNIKKPKVVPKGITVFTAPVIYELLDNFTAWRKDLLDKKQKAQKESLPKVCVCKFLDRCSFRQSNPAVFGVEVLRGTLTKNSILMKKDGSKVNIVQNIQEDSKDVPFAEKNAQVAIAIPGVTIGRQIHEGDVFYTMISESDFLSMKKQKDLLSAEEIEIVKEIAEINRTLNPVWGIEE